MGSRSAAWLGEGGKEERRGVRRINQVRLSFITLSHSPKISHHGACTGTERGEIQEDAPGRGNLREGG